jgi:hypothetical protein
MLTVQSYKVNIGVGIVLSRAFDKGFNELVVFCPSLAFLFQTKIQFI